MLMNYRKLARIGSAVALLVTAASSASALDLFGTEEKEACLSDLRGEIGLCTNTLLKLNVAAAEAKAYYGKLQDRPVAFIKIKDGYKAVADGYQEIDEELSNSDQNFKNPKTRNEYKDRLTDICAREGELDRENAALKSEDGGNEFLKQKAENFANEYENLSALWEQQYNEVRKHKVRCGHDVCERRAASLSPLNTGVEQMNKELDVVGKELGRVYEEAQTKQDQVKAEKEKCRTQAGKIARRFGFTGIKDMKSLIGELEKFQIVFYSGDDVFKNESLGPDRPLACPREIPEAPKGRVFYRWQKVGDTEEFSGWDKPVTADISLEAAWGYPVYIGKSEEPAVIISVREGEVTRAVIEKLGKAPANDGEEFAGWLDEDNRPLREGTRITSGMRLHPDFVSSVFTAMFYHNGVNFTNVQCRVNEVLEKPKMPCENCLFWGTSTDAAEEWDGFGKPLAGDIKLAAVHPVQEEVKEFEVQLLGWNGELYLKKRFREDGGELLASWLKDTSAASQKGWHFTGWKQAFDASSSITEDMQFSALFEKDDWRYIWGQRRKEGYPAFYIAVADVVLLILGTAFSMFIFARKNETGKAA